MNTKIFTSLPQDAKLPTEETAIDTKPNNRFIFIIFILSDEINAFSLTRIYSLD